MITEERLLLLKSDLGKMNSNQDILLRNMLKQAEEAIKRNGIKEEKSISYDMLVIQYAAYIFRKRASSDTAMPLYLHRMLNDMLFSQKGKIT